MEKVGVNATRDKALHAEEDLGRSTFHFRSNSEQSARRSVSIRRVEPQGHSQSNRRATPSPRSDNPGVSFSEFVERVFVPRHVYTKGLAGRQHFCAMLKHIMTPERVNRIFGRDTDSSKVRLRTLPDWPYLDELPLDAIGQHNVGQLLAVAIQRGYSSQTVTHMRNVVSEIFAYAQRSNYHFGENPASNVALPEMERKKAHALTLNQLSEIIRLMRYPEREAALLAALTDMNMCEICGLQWKNVNLSQMRRMVDGEWIPPRSIAVRTQHYRCQTGPVLDCRKRTLAIPEVLCSMLGNLRDYRPTLAPEDFVFAARNGSPICQSNLANRKLKVIGRKLGMTWLTWQVFRRTYVNLSSELGAEFNTGLKKALPIERTISRVAQKDAPLRGRGKA